MKCSLELIQHYPFQVKQSTNVMMLNYTCLASPALAQSLEIETIGFRYLRDDRQTQRMVMIMIDNSLNEADDNTLKVPFTIIRNFKSNKKCVQIIRRPIQLINPFLPQLKIAKEIKIYYNSTFIVDPFFTSLISSSDFICQTSEYFIDSSWLQSGLKSAKSQKIKLEWTLYLRENQKKRYKHYFRVYIEVEQNESGFFLFKKGATTMTIKSEALHPYNKYTAISLTEVQKKIFSIDPYKDIEKRIRPCQNGIVSLQSDKNVNLNFFCHYLAQNIMEVNYIHINCQQLSSSKQFWTQFQKITNYQSSLILISSLAYLQQIYQSEQILNIKIKEILKMIQKSYEGMIFETMRTYKIVIDYQGKIITEDMLKKCTSVSLKLTKVQKRQCFQYLMEDEAQGHELKDQIIENYHDKFGWQILQQFLQIKWANLQKKEKSKIFQELNKILKQQKVQNLIQVSWDDVGGLQIAKEQIKETIMLPIKHPQIFDEWIKPRTGLLFYGPPGTGKTLLGKCIAKECKISFISVKGPELLNMYVGQSEKNVRQIFERANAVKPCIVFMDELDALIPKRGNSGDSNQVMDRIVAQLLMQMDLASSNQIFIIGATNRPDLLDPSILRPGRFDKQIYLGITKSKEDRIKILKAQTRHLTLQSNFNWELLLQNIPQNFTGADFYGLTSKAVMAAAERTINQCQNGNKQDKIQIKEQDFIRASVLIKPSVTEADLSRYQQLKKIYS